MELLQRYLPEYEFESYEEFKKKFKINIPENFDFARDIVDEWAKYEPEKKALVYCTDDGDDRIFTFKEISVLSKKAATYFTRIGIGKGDRVVTLLRRRWEYWIIAVACARIGAVVAPSSIQMTTKDIAYRINSAKAKMLIALDDEFVMKQIDGIGELCPSLKRVAAVCKNSDNVYDDFDKEMMQSDEYEGERCAENSDEMVIYFTSGTSGYPKMAIHNRLYPLGHIVTAKFMQRVQNNGLHLTQTDSGWAKFGWGNIYGQWICGSAILAYDPIRFNTFHMMAITEKYKPTSICIPPTMYRFLLRDGLEKKHIESVKWFSTAGEPLSGEVNDRFRKLTGHYIHEGYGQSEGTPITCTFSWLDVRPASMGKPSPLYDTVLVHPDGSLCKTGETGEIVMRIHDRKNQLGLLDCYCLDGKRTDPAADGVYHTGDTAYADEDGYFWYVGRVDDMIKCSGYRIGPFEIESILNAHPAVKESAIVGAPDPVRGQIVCAVIALNKGYEASDELTKELQTYVKKSTAPYKYPRRIVYIDSLPKTSSGKIIRNQAKEYVN